MTAGGIDWPRLRRHVQRHVDGAFALDPKLIHLNAMLVASPPRTVRDAIAHHQRKFNRDPIGYLLSRVGSAGPPRVLFQTERVAQLATSYLGLKVGAGAKGTSFIAQTGSTTMGLALVANGIKAKAGQHVVTSAHDFFSMRDSWKLRSARSGLRYTEIRLFEDPSVRNLKREILRNIRRALNGRTRVLSLTWVHSNTGVKLPIARIGELVREHNRSRRTGDRIIFCVDGVHGFGVETASFSDLHCDFFVAGCHKWLFGPRGTGIICALPRTWKEMDPTIPSFLPMDTPGAQNTPGGVQTYEYAWALAEAFEFHKAIGKIEIAQYTHVLAQRLKLGLAALPHVHVVTPMEEELSAGIVCCDILGVPARDAESLLRQRGIVATSSSEDADGKTHLRFSPSILNDKPEIDRVISAVAGIG